MHTAENIIFADNYQQAFESLINCKCILSKSEDVRLTIVFRAHAFKKKVCKIKLYYSFLFTRPLCALSYAKPIKKDRIRLKHYFYLLIRFEFDQIYHRRIL